MKFIKGSILYDSWYTVIQSRIPFSTNSNEQINLEKEILQATHFLKAMRQFIKKKQNKTKQNKTKNGKVPSLSNHNVYNIGRY